MEGRDPGRRVRQPTISVGSGLQRTSARFQIAHAPRLHRRVVAFLIVASPAIPNVRWYDGAYLQPFEPQKTLKVNELILVTSPMHENQVYAAGIRKIQIFIDGKLVCTDNHPQDTGLKTDCVWRPVPGRYKLQAVATDEDGEAGKSEVIEVVIERP